MHESNEKELKRRIRHFHCRRAEKAGTLNTELLGQKESEESHLVWTRDRVEIKCIDKLENA